MIKVVVISCVGHSMDPPLAAEFDETGGTIGRSPTNQLVLPDPDKHISRVQAGIVFRGGNYLIINQGSVNPVIHNGLSLGHGNSAVLKDCDEIRICDFVMQVRVLDPFKDNTLDLGLDASPMPTGAGPGIDSRAPPSRPETPDKATADPFAMFGANSSASANPFGDLLGVVNTPATPQVPPAASRIVPPPAKATPLKPPPTQGGGIPDDFDPFADAYAARSLHAPPEVAAPANLPDEFGLGISPSPMSGGGQSIDALFGLSPGGPPDLLGPGSILGEPISQPNTAPVDDPLSALGLGRATTTAPTSDKVPEIHSAFTPPPAIPDGTLFGTPFKPAAAPQAASPKEPAPGMFVSWDKAPLANSSAPPSAAVTKPVAVVEPAPPRQSVAPSPMQPLSPTLAASQEELMRSLAKGLGIPGLTLPQGITPESMEMIGGLLREAVQGTVDLLLARALIKREVKADVTMIVGRNNNPLKFSPDVATALQQLLMPAGRGFMTPTRAMQDAYDDLRSHQFGFMAGMRSALAGVLARFDPQQLEARLTQKSVLDNWLPMNRRAKLWDLFAEMYKEISQEAEDDFHELFGREFLRAYEEQVSRLRKPEK